MKKMDFLKNSVVQSFIKWMVEQIDQSNQFVHSYDLPVRSGGFTWQCSSIFDAFTQYRWRFKSYHPITQEIVSGITYAESLAFLNTCNQALKNSMSEEDTIKFKSACFSILKWGGVTRSNVDLIGSMDNPISYFKDVLNRLDPITVDLNDSFKGIHMNSGFTKIYSELIDDFIIYDSRVGAALGFLVRRFLEDQSIDSVPDPLKFAFGAPRSAALNRNPSSEQYIFPQLRNNAVFHIKNNIKANWIAKELAQQSRFHQVDNGIRALEAALFMIGYHIPKK